jgi:PAP2 superfamily
LTSGTINEAQRPSRSGTPRQRGRRARLLTWGGLAVYLAFSAVAFTRWNLVTRQDWLWVWLLGGLLAVSLADLRGWVRGVLRDWLPFMAIILAYDLLRGMSDSLGLVAHSQPAIAFDRFLFGGNLPTLELQHKLFPGHQPLHWYDYATWVVYSTHFLTTVLVAAVLWRINRERFRRFSTRVVTLAFAGMATFAVFPTRPPWLAALDGIIPPTRRIIHHVSNHLGFEQIGAIYEKGSHFANAVAAVPSLHAAFPMLLLLFFWSGARWAVRAFLGAYVLAMGFVLVYSGEHYVFDILVGWAYAGGTMVAVEAVARARGRRREAGLGPVALLRRRRANAYANPTPRP